MQQGLSHQAYDNQRAKAHQRADVGDQISQAGQKADHRAVGYAGQGQSRRRQRSHKHGIDNLPSDIAGKYMICILCQFQEVFSGFFLCEENKDVSPVLFDSGIHQEVYCKDQRKQQRGCDVFHTRQDG